MLKTTKKKKSFYSPGKVIISGEHSVVYGYPALVTSINLGITVSISSKKDGSSLPPHIQHILEIFRIFSSKTLEGFSFTITSTLPQNSGLGSSAALAYALFQACASWEGLTLTQDQYFSLIQEAEIFAHGKPSGIDASAVVYQGCLHFQKKDGAITRKRIEVKHFPQLFLIQSGKAVESTKEMVEHVAKLQEKDTMLQQIGNVTEHIEEQMVQQRFDGKLFSENERLLEKIGVVGDHAQSMIGSIEKNGGFAKIAGAGGIIQGSGMILVYHPHPEKLHVLADKERWTMYAITMERV